MFDYQEELQRRIEQFSSYLKKMYQRSHEEVCGPCFMIFSENSPDVCSGGDELAEEFVPAMELSLVTFDDRGFNDQSLNDDLKLLFSDIPDESWRKDNSQKRFIQFSFEQKWFCLDMPLQTLYRVEAEQIVRSRRGFFYLKDRPEFTLYEEDVEGYEPFRKIYVYGDEDSAAEDMAFIFFQIWKFPVDWQFYVKAAAFDKESDWENDEPIE